jgi:flagellar L-ring protein precursor FlgH
LKRFALAPLLCAVCALSTVAFADSLFPVKEAQKALHGSSNTAAASLYSDVRARNVGDILTVTISESTTAKATADTNVKKDESVSGFASSGLFQRFFRDLNLSASSNRNASGSGSTSRTGSLVTTLSVQVKEILPNGILRIEGSRLITINKETQRVTLTGMVRPEDITLDNAIPSNLIASAEVKYDGKGIIADTQKQGILTRIFKFLF